MVDELYSNSASLAKKPSSTATAHMYYLSRLYILATTLTLFVGTNASPAQSLRRTAPTSVAFNATSLDCFPPALRGSRQADVRDCLYASLLLPEGSKPGFFRDFGIRDEYALPRVARHDTCMVTVSMSGGNQDYSSWTRISQVANQLTMVCAVGQFPLGRTGGITYIGTSGKIRVTVEKSRATTFHVGDGTVDR